jgi:hypothetical protein
MNHLIKNMIAQVAEIEFKMLKASCKQARIPIVPEKAHVGHTD